MANSCSSVQSLYYYYANKWHVAWRLVGNIARIILELGLNRALVLDRSFPDPKSHSRAVNVIWTIFVLEKQLSFALGLPATLQKPCIDPLFPRPVRYPTSITWTTLPYTEKFSMHC